MRRILFFLIAGCVAFGQQRNFVSCPIVRDTKTVPCFLAEHDGETYYLGIQQDITNSFHPPQLKHEVLVEGRIVEGPRVCGGIPLQPLSISVLKEVNLACNTLLPAEPGIDAPPAPRGPGPSSKRLETAYVSHERPTGVHEFAILYSFDDDYLEFAPQQVLTEAAEYAKRIHAAKVSVTGYQGTTQLSNGNKMVEKVGLAEKRAQNIATLLHGLAVSNVTVEWKADPESGDPSRRRVTVLVTP